MTGEDAAEAAARPRGPMMGNGRVGIIDVGSNSVRLVLYERASRAPTVFFNEKVLAGLGEGVAVDGKLTDEATDRALSAITRFVALAQEAEVQALTIVATAAARDASNGPAFISKIETLSGQSVRVLDGSEEAEMAAAGVLCGFWQPDGVVGDLGGGSLELIDVAGNTLGPGSSFPLGTLRLRGDSGQSLEKAAAIAAKALSRSSQLPLLTGRDFYAVGGTWRSIFRLHMMEVGYPISIMHHYKVHAGDMAAFCDRLLKEGLDSMKEPGAVSKGRRGLVPWGALVLREIIRIGRPQAVVASALGVREGLIYDTLGEEERARDPLILAAEELAVLRSRSPRNASELVDWTTMVFNVLGVSETEAEVRLRGAACLLADIAWRAHPDYRGDQAIAVLSNVALYGIDHPGRGYIATALHDRYGGFAEGSTTLSSEALCSARMLQRAKLLAAAFRVAFVIAPGVPHLLPRTRMVKQGETLTLLLPSEISALDGERPARRMRQLAKSLNMEGRIEVGEAQPMAVLSASNRT
ncbi:MAG: Ppx/GppA phosphatase family protein [Devosia sp.]